MEELNNSNVRERQLQNTIIKLNNQLKDNRTEGDENTKKENEKEKKDIKDNIDNGNDFEEQLKLAREQIILIKEDLKETKYKLEQLIGQVKELLKNVKCDNKNKPQFAQICQILGLSPQTTNKILTNNKKGINW